MNNELINPHLLTPKYKKWQPSPWIDKKYLCLFIDQTVGHIYEARRQFRRASDAETYAQRLHARWIRLYDAAIVAMVVPTPAE